MKRSFLLKHLRPAAQAVPLAALMLGAAEAATTVGLNFQSWYYDSGANPQTVGFGYGYQTTGFPVTAKAFGVEVADWTNTDPIAVPHYGGPALPVAITGLPFGGGLTANITATNMWESGLTAPGVDGPSPGVSWFTDWPNNWVPANVTPGEYEVAWSFLDNTGWTMDVTGLNAKFPSGYVLALVGGTKTSTNSNVTVSATGGSTLATISFNVLADNLGFGASPALTADSITLQNDSRDVSNKNCALAGLIITDKPVVWKSLAGATIASGGTISLTAEAIGLPTLHYQWRKDGVDIEGATSPTYTKTGATTADSGSYDVVVTNDQGSATSTAAPVTVVVPPTLTWDADGGTPGAQDGGGIWNLTNTNWWDGTDNVAWSDLGFAVFGAGGTGSNVVTLGDNVTVSGLTFSDANYTINTSSDKILTFSGDCTTATNSNCTLSIPIAGTGALTKTGSGTLAITSRGTFSGPITIEQGTLDLPSGPPGYWYQWLLNTSVINLKPGTTLTCNGGAFGWYGNNNASGVTINIDGALCQPNGAFGVAYVLKGGTIGTGTNRLDLGASGGFNTFVTTQASSTTSVINPPGSDGVLLRLDSGQMAYTFTTALGTTPSGVDLDLQRRVTQWGSGGTIIKAGAGTMKLSEANNFNGNVSVNEGTLWVGQPWTVGSTASVANGATLKLTAAGSSPALSASTLTLGSAGATTLDIGNATSDTVAVASATTLNVNGPVTINVSSVARAIGHYPLVKFTGTKSGAGSFVAGTFPSYVTATLVDDTAGASKSVYLDVTAVVTTSLTWTAATNILWDVDGTENWVDGSSTPRKFYDGDNVSFDDTPAWTDVTLNSTASPSLVVFNNPTRDYTLGGTGKISGLASMGKSGAGKLTVTLANDYSGTTTVNSGSGLVSFGDGTPGHDGTPGIGGLVNNASISFNYDGSVTASYAMSGTGTWIKDGPGTFIQQGNKNFNGGLTINAGTYRVNAGGWYVNPFGLANVVTVNTGGTLQTSGTHSLGVDANTIRIVGGTLQLAAENYISGLYMEGGLVTGGELRTWGGTMTFVGSPTGSTIASPFSLVGSATLNVGDDVAAPDDLTISGVIFNSSALTKTGAGLLKLTAANTYTGNTTISAGTLKLGPSGSINGSPVLDVVTGATFDVTEPAGWTVATGHTLKGGGTVVAGFGNKILFASGSTLTCSLNGGSSSQISFDGDLDISGAALTANVISAPTASEYVIATYTGTLTGTFTSVPAGYSVDYATPGQIILKKQGYDAWALAQGLDGSNNGKDLDPDNDGVPNLLEFALGGNPLNGGDKGPSSSKVQTVSGQPALTLTIATRAGALFAAGTNGAQTATMDDVTYRVEGSLELGTWTRTIAEIPALIGGLPSLPSGYEYHTFKAPGPVAATPKDFLRVTATMP